MDKFSKKKRSEIMSRVKSENTSLELLVFHYLRSNGLYFQTHYRKAHGNPDIALPSKRRAVFIDGDFWHGWGFVKIRQGLSAYWVKKISSNVTRDKRNRRRLKSDGWQVLRVWEHQLAKSPSRERYLEKIREFLY